MMLTPTLILCVHYHQKCVYTRIRACSLILIQMPPLDARQFHGIPASEFLESAQSARTLPRQIIKSPQCIEHKQKRTLEIRRHSNQAGGQQPSMCYPFIHQNLCDLASCRHQSKRSDAQPGSSERVCVCVLFLSMNATAKAPRVRYVRTPHRRVQIFACNFLFGSPFDAFVIASASASACTIDTN